MWIAILLITAYVVATIYTNRHYKQWPIRRTFCWIFGVIVAVLSVTGPLAEAAHMNFTYHMIGHLLFGMLAPLLLVFSAPVTLLLRTLPTKYARYLTKLLKSTYAKVITHPAVATAQNIAGPYGLYTMGLYSYMHENDFVYFFIHMHIFLAAYLFTMSIIYIDPVFHRHSFRKRALALIIGIAGHSVIAKWIYIQPPIGVTPEHAQTGAYFMYYGGDLIEGVLIFTLCWQWYKATRKYSYR